MSVTYCGKSCEDCTHREELACPGCKLGPGRTYGGDCALAKCSRQKGHEDCGGCRFKSNCGNYQSREFMPVYRLRAAGEEKRRAEEIAGKVPFFGKWLGCLFWLLMVTLVASFLTNDAVVGWIPALRVPGQVLNALCSAAYCLILLKLSSKEAEYRVGAICALISVAISLVLAFVVPVSKLLLWGLVLALPSVLVSLVQSYSVFTGHGEVFSGMQEELAERWLTLRKWFVRMYGLLCGSLLVAIVFPGLGLLAVLAGSIGLVIVHIMELIWLHRSVKWLRNFSQ